jgi:hypothetical protein
VNTADCHLRGAGSNPVRCYLVSFAELLLALYVTAAYF